MVRKKFIIPTMSSIDRLIALTQKTGDKLVVHDSREGTEVIILPLTAYEKLIERPRAAEVLSSQELEEQINHDIALWRAKKEQEEEPQRAATLEQDAVEDSPAPITVEPSVPQMTPIPFVPQAENTPFQEESMADEPVFLEEPV